MRGRIIPRPRGRGPVEAMAKLASTSFRARAGAAPLKRRCRVARLRPFRARAGAAPLKLYGSRATHPV